MKVLKVIILIYTILLAMTSTHIAVTTPDEPLTFIFLIVLWSIMLVGTVVTLLKEIESQ